MKTYIANYTDKTTGSSWDLFIQADNYKDALKDARHAASREMSGCKFESLHLQK